MGLFVKRYDTGETVQVKKYIIDLHENEESIWSNDWYGRHVIGRHCEWCDGEEPSHDAPVGGLSKHAVNISVCECDEPIQQMTNLGMYCLRCENPIKQTVL